MFGGQRSIRNIRREDMREDTLSALIHRIPPASVAPLQTRDRKLRAWPNNPQIYFKKGLEPNTKLVSLTSKLNISNSNALSSPSCPCRKEHVASPLEADGYHSLSLPRYTKPSTSYNLAKLSTHLLPTSAANCACPGYGIPPPHIS